MQVFFELRVNNLHYSVYFRNEKLLCTDDDGADDENVCFANEQARNNFCQKKKCENDHLEKMKIMSHLP